MIVTSDTVFTVPGSPGPRAYLVTPDDALPHPGIVLIQEWWGVEPHIRDLAQKLASHGYIVMVPDLYHGQIATEPDDARKLVMSARENMERVLGEVTAAADLLRSHPRVNPKKLGIIGFCMGGTVTFRMACRYPHFAAASPWYGGGIDPAAEDLSKLTAPLLMVYGEADGGIPLENVRAVESALRAAGKVVDVRVYPGAGHAFLNDTHGSYDAKSAEDAWNRALAFFSLHLSA